jgi:hypothetical protein
MKKTILFIFLAFGIALFAAPVYANEVPALPNAFYGTVTIKDNAPAPVGTIIEARGDGVLTGIQGNPLTTTESGKYGGAGALEQKLIVQGDIDERTEISFYANGVQAEQTAAWQSGETSELNLTVPTLEVGQIKVGPDDEEVEVSPDKPQVVIGSDATKLTEMTVPRNVTNATINVEGLTETVGTKKVATLPTTDTLEIQADTSLGEVKIEIPAHTEIAAATSSNWPGIINLPTVKPNSSVTISAPGKKVTVQTVIEVGFGDIKLTLSNPVRLLVPGQAGKDAGYSRAGEFFPITTTCSGDSQSSVNSQLGEEGDCKINVGSDLVIWTKHFTKFVTYTQRTTGGGTTGGGAPDTTAPSISDIKVIAYSNKATISWKTNESSISWVVYGKTTAYGEELKTTTYTTSHSLTLSDLSPETLYHYQVKSKDISGNIGTYADKTFTTLALGEVPEVPEEEEEEAPALGALTEDQIQSILNLLEAFGAEKTTIANVEAALRGKPVTPPSAPAIEGCTIASFDRNLKQEMSGDDVKCLQIILNSDSATQLAASGVGSSGKETSYFGPLTEAAVIKFQEKYTDEVLAPWELTKGTGFVGKTSRDKLNSLLGR